MSSLASELLSTEVLITLSAKDLKDKDAFSKSDPVCVLYVKDPNLNDAFIEVGRTEQLKNCHAPSWEKKISMQFKFEEKQVVKFGVYDWDSKSNDVKKQDLIGNVECSLGEIMAFQGSTLTKPLPKKCGTLFISGEQTASCKETGIILAAAEGLDKKDTFGKSDPFLVFLRCDPNRLPAPVKETEVIKKNLSPQWKVVEIPLAELCSGRHDHDFKIECYDWDSNGKHDLIGECHTNINAIQTQQKIPLIEPKKKSKSSYKNSGMLTIKLQSIKVKKSFLDYIREGMQINFTVAVDFTASNGHPGDSKSLHYWSPDSDNLYSTAIKSVGEVIEDYDSDKSFPALGFGGKIPPAGEVSHEFFLNGQANPYCQGVQGILDAYRHSLKTVELYGPTNFTPVINHVAQFAKSASGAANYFVLLIITDGIITDMADTMRKLIEVSTLPMSIVIAGVGSADFSPMKFLDSDDRRISYEGKVAARDIVQFVDLNSHTSPDGTVSRKDLATAVLKEIPGQVVDYMRLH